jgi:hypothetical protein
MTGFRISESGVSALSNDTQMSDMGRLILELARQMSERDASFDRENLLDLAAQIIMACDGDEEKALIDLKSGKFRLERCDDDNQP